MSFFQSKTFFMLNSCCYYDSPQSHLAITFSPLFKERKLGGELKISYIIKGILFSALKRYMCVVKKLVIQQQLQQLGGS